MNPKFRYAFSTSVLVFLVFVVPFMLNALWLLIPVGEQFYKQTTTTTTTASHNNISVNPIALSISYALYFIWAFFLSLVMMDFAIPSIPFLFVIISFVLYVVSVSGISIMMWKVFNVGHLKMYWIFGILLDNVMTLLLYLFYGIWLSIVRRISNTKTKINTANDTSSETTEGTDPDESTRLYSASKTMSLHTEHFVSDHSEHTTQEYYVMDEGWIKQYQEKERKEEYRWTDKLVSWYTLSSIKISFAGKLSSTQRIHAPIPPLEERCMRSVWLALFKVFIYRTLMTISWVYLQFFITVWRQPVFFKVINIISLGLLFNISRTVFSRLTIAVGAVTLPTRQVPELKYYQEFFFNTIWCIFYRNLFIDTKTWSQFLSLAAVTLMFQIALYPGRSLNTVYIGYKMIRRWIVDMIRLKRWDPILYESVKNLEYKEHLKSLCVSYYIRQMSFYSSLFSFLVNFLLIRYTKYNTDLYPSYRGRSAKLLVMQMFVLLLIELVCDMVVSKLFRIITGKNIRNHGRKVIFYPHDGKNRSILLLAVSLTHMLHDIYFNLQVYTINNTNN
jgi:hypothetical protein